MKYLVVVIVAVFITACAEPGSVNVSTATPAETVHYRRNGRISLGRRNPSSIIIG